MSLLEEIKIKDSRMEMEREPGRSGSYSPALARAMTSITRVEIIDLTESSPPIEKEDETTFSSPDDGTHVDPEKSVATPSRRKHKNGEIGKAHGTPVRSRDSSLERGHAPSLKEISVQLAEGGKGSIGESARKKKHRLKKSKGKKKETDTSPPSREDTQKDTLPMLDDEQLFFIDTAPAPVPAGMAFDLKSADDAAAHTVPLLLPAHVSVLGPGDGFPVKMIEDVDSNSDSESYIEYLDYDDRLVRIPYTASSAICS
jgi:protein AIR1/2